MSVLTKLFSRSKQVPEVVQAPRECVHVALVPQWATPDDIGKEDRASHFLCAACSSSFSPDETRRLRETEAERLRNLVGS